MAKKTIGSDGLLARDNGEWGEGKLAFLDHFAPPALRATATMRRRCYVDLFAGPGLNRVRGSQREFDGSPLRAIEVTAASRPEFHFTDAFFVNLDIGDHRALARRVDRRIVENRSRITRSQIRCICGDANQEVRTVLDQIEPLSYVFAFADMEAPSQCHWSTIEALRRYRRHKSVDLYILFPLDMALKRLVSRNQTTVQQSAPVLDAFFGCDEWRRLLQFRASGSESDRQALGRGLLELYMGRLGELWKHVQVVSDVRRGTNHRLYKMIFASNHDAGQRIAGWAERRANDQFGLGL